ISAQLRCFSCSSFWRKPDCGGRMPERISRSAGPKGERQDGASQAGIQLLVLFFSSFKSRASAPLRGAAYFSCLPKRSKQEKAPPEGALSGPPALRVRERAAGFAGRTSVYIPRTAAHPVRPPSDFSSARSPHLRGPR